MLRKLTKLSTLKVRCELRPLSSLSQTPQHIFDRNAKRLQKERAALRLVFPI